MAPPRSAGIAGHELGRVALGEVEVADVRVREVLRQQPELGQHRRPAPRTGAQLEDLDLERVARPGALDVDGAEQVVERVEVELRLLVRPAVLHLAVPGHPDVEVDRVTGIDAQRGLEPGVPFVVDPRRIYDVLASQGARLTRVSKRGTFISGRRAAGASRPRRS
ncbi:MAG: hypothetical protein QOD59_1636, partial [Mycobacterium sp.]|nr:hypothetical protein [Mycobacterium sp.]